jgi:hypothetical protein
MISCSGEVLFKLFRLLTAQAGSNLVMIRTIAIFKKSTYQHSIFAFAGYEKKALGECSPSAFAFDA